MSNLKSHILEDERFTIERCPHDSENPYAQILNEILRHKELSIEAIFLLSYLLSNDRKWKINISQIVNHLKGRMGRSKVYKIINELIEFGYMEREIVKKGNLNNGCRYFISEKPKFKKCFRRDENENTGSQRTEEQHYKNNHSSKKTKKTKEQQEQPAIAVPVVSHIKKGNVSLSDEQRQSFEWMVSTGCSESSALSICKKYTAKEISLASGYLQTQMKKNKSNGKEIKNLWGYFREVLKSKYWEKGKNDA